MNADQFKMNSKVTYVWVEGEPHGIVVPLDSSIKKEKLYRQSFLNYSGYIVVPYSYDEFVSFNEAQRKAICQAELSKSGWCIQINACNPNSFFEDSSE